MHDGGPHRRGGTQDGAAGAWLVWATRAYRGEVTTWNLGDEGPDVLSAGDAEPPWAGRVRTAAVAVACLVLGGVLALRLDDEMAVRRAAAAPAVLLRAGNLQDAVPCRRRCLRLPLFNAGRRPVEVTDVGFAGWRVPTNVRSTVIRPGTWGNVRFGLPADCSTPLPVRYRSVQVQTHVAGVPRARTLRMPSATPLVQEEHARTCPVGRQVSPQELRGVWLLASSHGAWHSLSGALVMRYGAGGSFAWDVEGHLLDARAADGRYLLRGRMLTVMVNNQNACHTGDVFTWRVTLTAPDQLNLQSVPDPRSACGAPDDGVWVVRRILADDQLPEIDAAP
jgi:hypothetical protein